MSIHGPKRVRNGDVLRLALLLTLTSCATVYPTLEEESYREALNLLKAGQYDQSIKTFSDFLVKYPGGRYADNAQYWLAESYYVTRQFEAAIVEYTTLAQNYPQSQKLTHALLKIGYCYHELGQLDQAKASLAQLMIRYPYATASVLANHRLNCINYNFNVTTVRDAEGKPLYYLEVCRDGHTPQVILESPQPIKSPTWSLDRKELAYISFESGRAQIFVQDIASPT